MKNVIVSRHPAAIEFIRTASVDFADAPVIAQATADDVRGKVVAGNLPLHLAAVTAEVVAVEFAGAPPRGLEYTLADMQTAGAKLARYRVSALPAVRTDTRLVVGYQGSKEGSVNNVKQYSLGVLLSITTRRLLCEFSDMHECCEFLSGGPIWTHQFAFLPFVDELKRAVLKQHPTLEAPALYRALKELVLSLEDKNQEDVRNLIRAWLKSQGTIYGDMLPLVPMSEAPHNFSSAFTEPLKGKFTQVPNPSERTEAPKK